MPQETGPTNHSPESVADVRGLLDKMRLAVGKKFYTYLAEEGTQSAEQKLNPLKGSYDDYSRFKGMREDLKTKIRVALENYSFLDPQQEIAQFVAEAEKLGEKIRRENVSAYLALRNARKYAKTPEEKEKLEDLLKRQDTIRRLMQKPEFTNHLEEFRTYILKDLERLEVPLDPEKLDKNPSLQGQPSHVVEMMEKIYLDMEGERVKRSKDVDHFILDAIKDVEGEKAAA
jgi:hypothetical protein